VAFCDGGILRFFSRPPTINRAKALGGPLFLAARDHALVKIGQLTLDQAARAFNMAAGPIENALADRRSHGMSCSAARRRPPEICGNSSKQPRCSTSTPLSLVRRPPTRSGAALTEHQCARYDLPRSPIKETETRAGAFQARFGEGATELDALEALHPGELRRILQGEVERYIDLHLAGAIADAAREVQADLNVITERVRRRHAEALAALEADRIQLFEAMREFEIRSRPVLAAVEADLQAEKDDADIDPEWPEPEVGEEDDAPMFDSTRAYLDQIEHYKRFQGKPTEAAPRKTPQPFQTTCQHCGKPFMATRRDART
jgi:hypothetical protein